MGLSKIIKHIYLKQKTSSGVLTLLVLKVPGPLCHGLDVEINFEGKVGLFLETQKLEAYPLSHILSIYIVLCHPFDPVLQ